MIPEDTILALIPAWNEAKRITPVIEATQAYLPVLVVDDGSTDETAVIAKSVGASRVRHSQNRGKGVALMTGFEWALERGFEAVVTLDADGQHDPADIPKFLEAYEAGVGDLIIGRRDFSKMPFPRSYTNPFGSWLLSLVMGQRIYDNQSGFRLHHRCLLEDLELTSHGFELEVEIIVQAIRMNIEITWVNIRTIYSVDKVSYFHPLRDSARFLATVWRTWQEQRSN